MSAVRTCTTPEEGWKLCNYFLCNLLWVLRHSHWEDDIENERAKNYQDGVISNAWAKLTGNLYMIMRRMKLHGHDDVAAKMQQIIDMVVELDLTDHDVCESIQKKEAELNPSIIKFRATMDKNRVEYAM